MSLYHLQKFLYELNRDETVQCSYKDDIDLLIENYSLSEEEKVALKSGDIGLLYVPVSYTHLTLPTILRV